MKIGFIIIDIFRNTNVVGEFKKIKREYSLDFDQQYSIREKKINQFLEDVKKNAYYKKLLNQLEVRNITRSDNNILKILPILKKEDIRKNFNLILDKTKKYELNFTGGSTGQPLRYAVSKKSLSRIKAFNYYLWNKYLRYEFGDKILVIGGSSLPSNKKLKHSIYNYLQNKIIIDGTKIKYSSIEKNLEKFLNGKYEIIYGYPSVIEKYVDYCINSNRVFNKKIKGIVTTSEMLEDRTKEKFSKYFNSKVLNIYGANDGGVISGSIDNRLFHFNYLDCIVTTVENTFGKYDLLITNLNSDCFPFVNYMVGDVGNVLSTESFDFPNVIIDLEGRSRDIIKNSRGDIFHGAIFNKIIKDFISIERYQIIQQNDYTIDIILNLNDQIEFDEKRLIQRIRELINDQSISIKIEFNKAFIELTNQKHKTIISYVS
jgi:phenylacetate-CoA ligase